MSTRRDFLSTVGVLASGAASAQPQEAYIVFTKATQSATTPEQALPRLKEGNTRFLTGLTIHCDLRAQVKDTASGQAPFAAVLGCMDSRVPPELVFDQRLGDIFAVRMAGNFVNTDIVGSLEYTAQMAGACLSSYLGIPIAAPSKVRLTMCSSATSPARSPRFDRSSKRSRISKARAIPRTRNSCKMWLAATPRIRRPD